MIVLILILFYIEIAILTYYTINLMFLSNIDYSKEEERELADDKKRLFISSVILSSLWIIYIPYVFIKSMSERGKTE